MTRQERTSDNPGREVARRYRELMSIDREWSFEHDDGFTWWAHRLAQRIRFSEAWKEDEFVLSRVSAETDFLLRIHEQQEKEFGFAMGLSAMSSAVRDPRTGVIRLRSAMLVHHATKAQVSRMFACAASIQVAMAELFADNWAARLSTGVARSDHPTAGPRPTPDEMLSMIDETIRPLGYGPSAWASPTEFDYAAARLREVGLPASSRVDASVAKLCRMWAAIPLGSDDATPPIFLRVSDQSPHPLLGSGISLSVLLPPSVTVERRLDPLRINELEATKLDHPHEIGSWCYTAGGPGGSEVALTYACFVPNMLFAPGLLAELCIPLAIRALWVRDTLLSDEPRATCLPAASESGVSP